MTKKNKPETTEEVSEYVGTENVAEEAVTAPSDAPGALSATEPVVSEDPDAGLPFTVDQWRGLPCYRCSQYPYDRLKEDEAWAHAERHKPAPVTPTSAPVLIYGPDGQPISTRGGL